MPLSVQFWYPAVGSARRRSWARRLGALRRGFEAAEEAAPPAADPATFPLLLYFPGWPGTRVDNRFLITELASHGHAVGAVTYDGGSPDSLLRLDYSSASAYRQTVALAERRVRARAADAGALLDEISRLQGRPGSAALFRRLDLERLGVVGFSFGGAVAAELATRDARVRAAVNIDGRHWGTALREGVARPYLFIGEELRLPAPDDLGSTQPERRYNALLDRRDYSQLAANLRRHGGMQVTLEGSAHLDFTDAALRPRLRRGAGTGTIEPRRLLRIVGGHLTEFFGRTLNGAPASPHAPAGGTGSPPAPLAAPLFAEARVEVWNPAVKRPAESTPGTASHGPDRAHAPTPSRLPR